MQLRIYSEVGLEWPDVMSLDTSMVPACSYDLAVRCRSSFGLFGFSGGLWAVKNDV